LSPLYVEHFALLRVEPAGGLAATALCCQAAMGRLRCAAEQQGRLVFADLAGFEFDPVYGFFHGVL
jgi:hypothetical protein